MLQVLWSMVLSKHLRLIQQVKQVFAANYAVGILGTYPGDPGEHQNRWSLWMLTAAFHDSCTSHVSCILHINIFHLQISFWKHFEGPIHKLPFGSTPRTSSRLEKGGRVAVWVIAWVKPLTILKFGIVLTHLHTHTYIYIYIYIYTYVHTYMHII